MEAPQDISAPEVMSFEEFWGWLQSHYNCILRVGYGAAVVYDDNDYHWHFGLLDAETVVVQVIRGKQFVAEIAIRPAEILHVRLVAPENDEHAFELVGEVNGVSQPVGFFVLSHEYDGAIDGNHLPH